MKFAVSAYYEDEDTIWIRKRPNILLAKTFSLHRSYEEWKKYCRDGWVNEWVQQRSKQTTTTKTHTAYRKIQFVRLFIPLEFEFKWCKLQFHAFFGFVLFGLFFVFWLFFCFCFLISSSFFFFLFPCISWHRYPCSTVGRSLKTNYVKKLPEKISGVRWKVKRRRNRKRGIKTHQARRRDFFSSKTFNFITCNAIVRTYSSHARLEWHILGRHAS